MRDLPEYIKELLAKQIRNFKKKNYTEVAWV